jgi:hypothetical protein
VSHFLRRFPVLPFSDRLSLYESSHLCVCAWMHVHVSESYSSIAGALWYIAADDIAVMDAMNICLIDTFDVCGARHFDSWLRCSRQGYGWTSHQVSWFGVFVGCWLLSVANILYHMNYAVTIGMRMAVWDEGVGAVLCC